MTHPLRSAPRFALLAMSTALMLMNAGCRSNEAAPQRESYVVAFLVSGPKVKEKTPEERQTVQAAHMANIGKLVDENKMVIAGPFGRPSPDESMRGIFIFDTGDVARAREWTETDPAVQAGVLGMELSRIRTEARLRRALELYRESLAKAGGMPGNDEMRGYAVVLAKSGERARQAMGGLRDAGKVVFEGDLDDSPRGAYLAVLEASEADEAKTMLEPIAAGLGEHTVFPWWATVTLLELKPQGK
ncbi:MAG: YciI family protein [Planctomycetota bacterium]